MDKTAEALAKKARYDISDLLSIMKLLRSENGCPWDREQNHKSIRNDFLEEAYEAVEAIDTNDSELLAEELGDVLLQVVFHSRIAEEEGVFSFDDVVDGISRKLVLRHPHVFKNTEVSGVGDVLVNWDKIKQQSKGRTTEGQALAGVSRALPSLVRASKLSKRAEKAGLPLPAAPSAFENISDELASLDAEKRADYVGRVLFSIAAEAKALGIDAEQALYDVCEKFVKDNEDR